VVEAGLAAVDETRKRVKENRGKKCNIFMWPYLLQKIRLM
jgi:hypothetical protein